MTEPKREIRVSIPEKELESINDFIESKKNYLDLDHLKLKKELEKQR